MYTYCPDCKTVFEVTAADLTTAAGHVVCGECGTTFSALATLSETIPDQWFQDAGSGHTPADDGTGDGPNTENPAATDPVDRVDDLNPHLTAPAAGEPDDGTDGISSDQATQEPANPAAGEWADTPAGATVEAAAEQTGAAPDEGLSAEAADESVEAPAGASIAEAADEATGSDSGTTDPKFAFFESDEIDEGENWPLLGQPSHGDGPPDGGPVDSVKAKVGDPLDAVPENPDVPHDDTANPIAVPQDLTPAAPAAWSDEQQADALDLKEYLEAERPQPIRQAALVAGSVLLVAALVVQIVHVMRADLAVRPVVGPWVQRAYQTLDLELSPNWDVTDYRIVDWQPIDAIRAGPNNPDAPDALLLNATFENRAAAARPYPQLRVVLTNRWNDPVAARDFNPREYLTGESTQGDIMMRSGQRIAVHLRLVDPSEQIDGFSLDTCLPDSSGLVRCTEDLTMQ